MNSQRVNHEVVERRSGVAEQRVHDPAERLRCNPHREQLVEKRLTREQQREAQQKKNERDDDHARARH